MKQVHSSGVIVFRNLDNILELLVLDYGNFVGHSKGEVENDENLDRTAIRELYEETRLTLLVISQEPIAEIDYEIYKSNQKYRKIVHYYAGITNPHSEVSLSDEHVGYKWVDSRAYKRIITYERDQFATYQAMKWLQDYTSAALKLSIDLEKLGYQ